MRKDKGSRNIYFSDLVETKIPAFRGAKALNNKLMLSYIATNGSSLPYDIFKDLGHKGKGFYNDRQYPTVYRRIKDLKKKGYIGQTGKRRITRGKQTKETQYGLTWKGFIASVAIEEVSKDIFQVLKANPLLSIPEKDSVLLFLEEFLIKEELEIIARHLLKGFLEAIPNLELIKNDPMSILALASSMSVVKFPKDFKLSRMPKDIWELLKILDKPAILQAIKRNIIPMIVEKTKAMETMYQILSILNIVGEYISGLKVEDQPSKKIREFVETKLESKLLDLKKHEIWREEQ